MRNVPALPLIFRGEDPLAAQEVALVASLIELELLLDDPERVAVLGVVVEVEVVGEDVDEEIDQRSGLAAPA